MMEQDNSAEYVVMYFRGRDEESEVADSDHVIMKTMTTLLQSIYKDCMGHP